MRTGRNPKAGRDEGPVFEKSSAGMGVALSTRGLVGEAGTSSSTITHPGLSITPVTLRGDGRRVKLFEVPAAELATRILGILE